MTRGREGSAVGGEVARGALKEIQAEEGNDNKRRDERRGRDKGGIDKARGVEAVGRERGRESREGIGRKK